jgi:hypothetical protein
MTEALQQSVCLEGMSTGRQKRSIDGRPAVVEAAEARLHHVPAVGIAKAMHTGPEAG